MKTDRYEIERIRRQYKLRGCRPLNRRRSIYEQEEIVAWSFLAVALLVPAIAAAMVIFIF